MIIANLANSDGCRLSLKEPIGNENHRRAPPRSSPSTSTSAKRTRVAPSTDRATHRRLSRRYGTIAPATIAPTASGTKIMCFRNDRPSGAAKALRLAL